MKVIHCLCQNSYPLHFYHLNTRSRDSSVGIVTGIWDERSEVREAYYSVLQNELRGSFAPWLKGPVRDVDNSPPSSVNDKNEWSCASISFICLHSVDKDNHFLSLNPLNDELNSICHLLALLGVHHFLHVSRIRVKSLILRLLMSHIYGAPILDVSRSHTTTQHSQ